MHNIKSSLPLWLLKVELEPNSQCHMSTDSKVTHYQVMSKEPPPGDKTQEDKQKDTTSIVLYFKSTVQSTISKKIVFGYMLPQTNKISGTPSNQLKEIWN